MPLGISTIESWLWEAACVIRGPVDAPKFKDYALPMLLPPLSEQREIAAQFAAVDAKLAAEEARRAALAALVQSLLQHPMNCKARPTGICTGRG